MVLLIIIVICTCLLAWWQWTRFQSGSGTFQNLGYAFQWPLFGAAAVYGYRKYLEYENEMIDAKNEHADDLDYLYERDAAAYGSEDAATQIDESFLPERPTVDVATFNSLNQRRRGEDDLAGLRTEDTPTTERD